MNRLIREDNKTFKKTWLYSYDNKGNILCKRETSFTLKENVEECEFTETLYSYDGDELLTFGAEMCEYDEIGNPKTYRGKTVAWEKGRQMAAYDAFAYDSICFQNFRYVFQGAFSDSNNLSPSRCFRRR